MATKKTGASGKAAPLDPKVAGKLLDKLSTNNEFRRLFKKDPKAALSSIGYKEPKGGTTALKQVYDCCGIDSIAPKADVIKARDALHSMFTAGLGMTPIQLNVSSTALRRTRK